MFVYVDVVGNLGYWDSQVTTELNVDKGTPSLTPFSITPSLHQFGMLESLLTSLKDEFPILNRARKELVSGKFQYISTVLTFVKN